MDLAPTSFAQLNSAFPHRRVGPRVLLTLLAGRSMFRVVLYGANLFLLGAWGQRVFARYAAACGAVIWITALAQAGPEKAALKLIPRAQRSRDALVAALLVAVRCAVIVVGSVAAIAITLDQQAAATLYIAEVAESVAIGVNAVAVGVRRSLGQPGYDTVNFALLSAGWILITAGAVVADINPALYVFAQLVLAVAITEVTLRGLRPPARAIFSRPRVLRILAGTIGFMGLYDVMACASASAAFQSERQPLCGGGGLGDRLQLGHLCLAGIPATDLVAPRWRGPAQRPAARPLIGPVVARTEHGLARRFGFAHRHPQPSFFA
jgi:hypothetical protein